MNNLSYYLARIYYALTRNTTSVIPSGDQDAWWAERIYRTLAGFPDRMSGGKNASFWLELAFYNKTNQAYRQATGTMPAWFWLSKLYAYYAGNATDSILQPANAAFWAEKLASIPNLGGLPEISVTVNAVAQADNSTFTPSNPVQGTTVQYTVTATNNGTANLTLTNATRSGAVTAATAWSSATLIPGASATCTITLDTASAGAQTGYFEFITNDFTGGEDTYRVNASYTVLAQNIKVTLGVTQVTDGGSYAAGDYNEAATAQVTCTVENIGDALLTLQNPTIDGQIVSASAFSDLTLTPSQSVTSTITLNTATSILIVARTGNIHIASDDPDTPSFDVQINFNANPVWIINDEFSSGNTTSPRTCTPGPGSWNIADSLTTLSVTGGELVASEKITGAGNPRVIDGTLRTRTAGLAIFNRVKRLSAFGNAGSSIALGFSTSATPTTIGSVQGIMFGSPDFVALPSNVIIRSLSDDTYYDLWAILGAARHYIVVNNKLEWVGVSAGNVYPLERMGIAADRKNNTSAKSLARQLSNDWINTNPVATTVLAGARSAGNTFTHEANAIIEWIQTTLPTALNTLLDCWQQDTDNKWEISVSNVGTISLTEIVATVSTVRATAVAVVSNGHRIVVKRDTTTIQIYSGGGENSTLRITYSSASNFQSATSGVLAALGTGGAVSDIITNPVDLSGDALAELVKGLS